MRMEMLSFGRLILCGFDVFMFCSFFDSMFSRRLNKKNFFLYSLSVALIVFFENAYGNTLLNLFLLPVLYILFSMLAFQVSLSNGIVYTLIYYIVFAAGREAAFELLYRLIAETPLFSAIPWFTPEGIYFLIVEYLFAFLFLFYIERFTRKLELSENNRFCWYLLILPISTVMILMSFAYMDFPGSRLIQSLMCGGAFLLYFTNAVLFIILERFTWIMNQTKYAELSILKRNMEKSNFDKISKINSAYQNYLHDIHKYFYQFRYLASKGEDERIINIIDELEGKIESAGAHVLYSSSPVLNSILTEAENKAKESGVDIALFVEPFLKVDAISDGDMISMFGNLLDNSIEAAAKCREEMRRVDVKIYMGSRYFLVLQIQNTYTMDVMKDGPRFLSTKKATRGHGLGIGIVRELALKYGGTLELKEMGDKFMTLLTVSVFKEE